MWTLVESTTVLLTIIYSVKIYKCTKLYVYIKLQYDEQYSKTGSDTSIHQQRGNWIHCSTFKLQHIMQIFEWMIQVYIYSQGRVLGIYCWVNQASYAHTLWSHFDLSTLFVNLYKIAYIYLQEDGVHIFRTRRKWLRCMPTAQNSLYLCKLYILDASLA